MIVCVCHRLNEAKIRAAAEAGVSDADEVHEFFDTVTSCGCCLDNIGEILENVWEAGRLAAE